MGNFNKVIRFMFMFSLLLYPLQFFNHMLYLFPQFLFIVIMLLKILLKERVTIYKQYLPIFIVYFAVVALPFFVEFSSRTPEYSMPVKIFINITTVVIMCFFREKIYTRNTAKYLMFFALTWISLTLLVYYYAESSLMQIALVLGSDEFSSSYLYELASPLKDVFITKNISAMFFVAVFGFFMYLKRSYGEKIKIKEILVFGILILSFFSRQGLLSFFVLLLIDKIFSKQMKLKTFIIVTLSTALIAIFSLSIFDVTNVNDGSNQRLLLWLHFAEFYDTFFWLGLGQEQLSVMLTSDIGIDNYHMFFMNQIACYGFFHFLYFNVIIAVITFYSIIKTRKSLLLIAPFFLNILFQTFGYEYQNLFLYVLLNNNINFNNEITNVQKTA